ncbi:Hypothetical predicted protein [Mytilus galloprovincialis]|uniref:ZMYM2-like/QRICH1 C-terminal domain-containing protein n=1 Tax=Mytilus galloprovincialis TaxID=29158 RepID=A0A8B6D8F0_MYTGA|nr:Hypothetical predicted protein [Mytilus galloprovincialis]
MADVGHTDNLTESMIDKQMVMSFIDDQKKKSTVNCTKRDLKLLYKWLVGKGELRSIEDIPHNELDAFLSEFYITLKRENGQEYEPGTFDGIRASIERYLKEKEYSHSLRDKEFNLSTRALSAKKVQLKKLGKGHKPNASKAVSKDEEDLLWEQGQLGDGTPRILIFSLWYYFTKCFGLRGRNEHRQLQLGDILMKKDPVDNRQYLEFSERLTKTRDGTKGKENRKVKPRMYENKSDRCPIRLFKAYLLRRPENVMEPESPFYLTCIPMERVESMIWYYARPMGENTLANLMPMAAKEAGMDRKTNHSVRKTTIKTLRKAGVPRDKIKHISGHKSTSSIEAYDDDLSDNEQREYSDVLTGVKSSLGHVGQSVTANESDNTCNNVALQKIDRSTVSHQMSPPMATSSQSVCSYTAAPNNIHEQSSKGASEALSNMFSKGTVLNNCTFNINFNMEQSNGEGQRHSRQNYCYEPPRKTFKRILPLESSDESQEF